MEPAPGSVTTISKVRRGEKTRPPISPLHPVNRLLLRRRHHRPQYHTRPTIILKIVYHKIFKITILYIFWCNRLIIAWLTSWEFDLWYLIKYTLLFPTGKCIFCHWWFSSIILDGKIVFQLLLDVLLYYETCRISQLLRCITLNSHKNAVFISHLRWFVILKVPPRG